MTNPDNVGGLPPLLHFAVFDEFGKGADDRVWDYGRRCFEAGMKFEGEHGLMTTNAPKRDSAPAGSGEVETLIAELEHYSETDYKTDCCNDDYPIAAASRVMRTAAALLRKLANGGEQCRDASVSTDNEFIGEAMGRLADEVEKPGSKVTITKADACAIGIYVRALSRGVPEGE